MDLKENPKGELLDFLLGELDRRQEVVERVCDLQNLALATVGALAHLPIDVEDPLREAFQAKLALIQESIFRLTEPGEPRN